MSNGGMGGQSSGVYQPRGGLQYQSGGANYNAMAQQQNAAGAAGAGGFNGYNPMDRMNQYMGQVPQTGGMSPIPQTQAPTDGSRFGFGPNGVKDGLTGEFYGGPRNRRFGAPPPYQEPGRFNTGPYGTQDGLTGEFYGGPRNRRFGPPPSYQQAYGAGGFTGQGFGQDVQPQTPPQVDSAPGFMVNQRAAASPAQTQSFEQFAQTLNGSGMTSGQVNDLYQKSISPQSGTNFWANTGVGTQQPAGFQTPENWGKQTYGFDPRSMAGKQVGPDMAWYYGRDAIGRNINNQGDAVAGFTGPADGFQRRRPWMG